MKIPPTIFPLSLEIEVLLDACRIAVGVTDREVCAALPGSVDGGRLLSLAEAHKVLPVFYQAMAAGVWKGVSEETRHQLIRLYSANVIRSQKAIKCLQRIVEVLDRIKIEYMTFKGPELSETIYGDPHLRSFVDIDLLVPRQKAIDAINGLIAAGFEPGIILSKETLPTYVHWEHFLPLVDDVSGTHIELHWELTGHYGAKPVEMDSLMTERASLLDREVCVPKAEIYLVYLCLHGSHHRWEKIDSICCVAGLIRQRPDLDWGLVLEVAREWRCCRDLFLALFLVKTFMGLTLSEDMDEQIRDDTVVLSLAREVVGRWNEGSGTELGTGPWMRFSFFHIKAREKTSDRLRYAFRLAFRPTIEDFRRHANGKRSLHFLPLKRPFRLAGDWRRTLGIDY